MVVDQVIEQGRVEDRGSIELFARDGRANHGKDARANHGANAQRGERPRAQCFLQGMLGELRVADQLVDRFGSEQLLPQRLGSCRTNFPNRPEASNREQEPNTSLLLLSPKQD